ncbi:MAG: ketoacyl-ACP synthase III [Bryobacterales bacterium]|nr:ketoacyl-ACP synthase III [Bryobacterales bacterium]
MAFIQSFGAALPPRIVTNQELAEMVGKTPEWIRNVSGIEERRWAHDGASVIDLAADAALNALARAGRKASEIGILLVSSGTWERQFPGPAAQVAARLGLEEVPALDIPVASAGGLFALVTGSELTRSYGPALVVASELMSRVARRALGESGTSVLFGDGAGACVLDPERGVARVVGHRLASDGTFAGDLALGFEQPLSMNGRSVILQASRKIPRVIRQVLERWSLRPADMAAFLMHQANQNLIDRIADALEVDRGLFFSNIRHYGNTSSASLLIAASEWADQGGFEKGQRVCMAAFGAGFHWGAALLEGC